MVNNQTYVYAEFMVSDQNKFDLLTGTINHPSGQYEDDWSMLNSVVMNLDADGGQNTVAYALVYGSNLAELQTNADAAIAAYNPVAPVTGETPRKGFSLAQNHPNPFNPLTNISFTISAGETVDLAIYDVGGRRIRTLVRESGAGGPCGDLERHRRFRVQGAQRGLFLQADIRLTK